ncbi:MAG: right-handed parallel beta-helix repeat-containing protein [Actinomycetota bacterium]|nr:right-handed parallel beta-helix repeat-containing protein [Actinomycetota bacterium]
MKPPLVSRYHRAGHLMALYLACLLAAIGCTSSSADSADAPAPWSTRLSAGCTETVSKPSTAKSVLDRVEPGDTICFTGDGLAGEDLNMTSSGSAVSPVTLAADNVTIRSLTVKADHVTVAGFRLIGGEGLTLEGTGVAARANAVFDAASDGVSCVPCTDAVIESNIVKRSDGSGIVIEGERITVRENEVSESVKLESGDADGIRFFGNGHQLTGNTIRDISDEGYGDDAPHTDCFQTFDNDRPPTYDVLISSNVCENVDVQCLIATGDDRGNSDASDGVPSVVFRGNTCNVGGAQVVLLRRFPDVQIIGNTISGAEFRGVMVTRGSTETSVIGNTVLGNLRPFEVDETSEPGFRAEDNVSR